MNEQEEFYNNLLYNLGNFGLGASFLTILSSMVYWKDFNHPLKIFFWYLITNLLINLLSMAWVWSVNEHYKSFWKPILDEYKIDNNGFFDGFFYISNFIFVGIFYKNLFKGNKNKRLISILLIFACILEVLNFYYIDGFRNQGFYGPLLDGLFLSIIPAYYLWNISKNPPIISIWKSSYYWISISLFILHLVSFVMVFVRKGVNESNFVLFCKLQLFNILIIVISQFSFLYAFSKAKYLKYL